MKPSSHVRQPEFIQSPNNAIGFPQRVCRMRCRNTDSFHACGAGGFNLDMRIFKYTAASGRHANYTGGKQVHLRIGLPMGDIFAPYDLISWLSTN